MKTTVKFGLAVLSLTTLIGTANAANPGAYVGLGLGGSRIESGNLNKNSIHATTTKTSQNLGGLGGRIFGGYNFNRYFGVEAGFAQYAQSKYTIASTVNSSNASLKYTMSALDLVGKAYLPIAESGFNVYALAGAARVNSTQKLTLNTASFSKSMSQTTHKVRPVYGLGTSYDVNEHVTTNLEFSHIQGNGKNSTVPSANMLTLNVAYNFG